MQTVSFVWVKKQDLKEFRQQNPTARIACWPYLFGVNYGFYVYNG